MNIVRIHLGIVVVGFVILASCGGHHSKPDELVSIAVSPATVTLDQGATQQFTATVTGSTNTAVTWTIQEGSGGGTISASGMYTAPAGGGSFHVRAASKADPSKSATATVSVNNMAITVSPVSADLEPGATQQFTAEVTGAVDRSVTWSVQEGGGGGSITNGGMYTAPASAGQFHVVATSVFNPAQSASVPVAVSTLQVLLSPSVLGIVPHQTRTFSASVAGSTDDRVTWAIQEGSVGGSITSDGIYTAPLHLGNYHVVATSVAHPNISGTARVAVVSSGFVNAGQMTQARTGHTATLLPNGDVLLVGGTDASGKISATAELYDYATGLFRASGTMKQERTGHTATLLTNGKVLVAGGQVADSEWGFPTDSAELYDPATGQFTPTGSMALDRLGHTATLLKDGKVLFVGGYSEKATASQFTMAELYDPEAGTFTRTGDTTQVRTMHAAALLPDGRVLITGGMLDLYGSGFKDVGSAEMFDPSTATFAATGSFVGGRESHSATPLANGQVLLAGGDLWNPGAQKTYDDAPIFASTTGTFSFVAKMNAPRRSHTATLLLNGKVLLVGGFGTDAWVQTAELYESVVTIFSITGSMAKPRAGHTATLLLDGTVLVTGGNDDSAEVYKPLAEPD